MLPGGPGPEVWPRVIVPNTPDGSPPQCSSAASPPEKADAICLQMAVPTSSGRSKGELRRHFTNQRTAEPAKSPQLIKNDNTAENMFIPPLTTINVALLDWVFSLNSLSFVWQITNTP